MRPLCWLAILTPLFLVAGCARFPETQTNVNIPPRTLHTTVTMAQTIDPNYYYFFAIDTDGNTATGPVAVVTGLGWGTLSNLPLPGPGVAPKEPPFFVEYHNGLFAQFRVDQTTGAKTPLGAPFRAQVLAADGTPAQIGPTIELEVDLRDVVPAGTPLPPNLQVNWITTNTVDTSETGGVSQPANKYYDQFDVPVTAYLNVYNLDVADTIQTGVGGYDERRNDTPLLPIDMIGWSVEKKVRLEAGTTP